MRSRILFAGVAALSLGVVPLAAADDPGPVTECETPNHGDRSTQVLEPASTLNQATLWVTADTGPDEAGVHVEPWARRAYFVDAGVSTDGSASATVDVQGDDGHGAGYLDAHATSAGHACAASPTAGAGATTGGDPDGGDPGDGDPGDGDPGDPGDGPPEPPGVQANQVVVTGPGAALAGYANRTVLITQGSSLDYVNGDLADHDVTSVERDDQGDPIFRSALIGLGEQAPVEGVEDLEPGTYGFFCSVHPNMIGSLSVQ